MIIHQERTSVFRLTTIFCLSVVIESLAIGCRHPNDYKIVSFSEDPPVSSGLDPALSHKFVLVHNGVRVVAHCWMIPEHHMADTSCSVLMSKVGQTVQMEHWLDQPDVLVYRPNGPDTKPQEILRVVSESAE